MIDRIDCIGYDPVDCERYINCEECEYHEQEEESWIFTFGCGQKHSGHYVKISGSFYEARQKMFDRFGDKWCFQYSEEEWERMKNDPKRFWDMETELEDYDE